MKCATQDLLPVYFCCLAVDGGWSPWSVWNQCTKKCGNGYQNRKRDCTNPKPMNGGRSCGSRSYETRYCNPHKCAGEYTLTAICVQAQTTNILSRLFTFETARSPFQTVWFAFGNVSVIEVQTLLLLWA